MFRLALALVMVSGAASAPDTAPPLTPAAPEVVAVEPGFATIRWAPTTDDVGVIEYQLHLVTSGGYVRVFRTTGTSVTIAEITGPAGAWVAAFDASWNRTDGPYLPLHGVPIP